MSLNNLMLAMQRSPTALQIFFFFFAKLQLENNNNKKSLISDQQNSEVFICQLPYSSALPSLPLFPVSLPEVVPSKNSNLPLAIAEAHSTYDASRSGLEIGKGSSYSPPSFHLSSLFSLRHLICIPFHSSPTPPPFTSVDSRFLSPASVLKRGPKSCVGMSQNQGV